MLTSIFKTTRRHVSEEGNFRTVLIYRVAHEMPYHWLYTFLLLQKQLTSGTELIFIVWKIVANESL